MRLSVFVILLLHSSKSYYYKMITLEDKQECVQAYVNRIIGNKFKAQQGKCHQHGCSFYKGNKDVPFIGKVERYKCESEPEI